MIRSDVHRQDCDKWSEIFKATNLDYPKLPVTNKVTFFRLYNNSVLSK